MTPEAAYYLSKARDDFDEAVKIAAIELATVAARSAYYAAFHAAQAFIILNPGVHHIDFELSHCNHTSILRNWQRWSSYVIFH